jgi:hypothetical protein
MTPVEYEKLPPEEKEHFAAAGSAFIVGKRLGSSVGRAVD